MSNPSNLYAEKVFSEHPIALWPLDEDVDYLSLISDADRDFSDDSIWTHTDCTVEEDLTLSPQFSGEAVYEVNSVDVSEFEIVGTGAVSEYLNPDLGSINISLYFYPSSTNILSVDVGYRYDSNGVPRHTDDAEVYSTITIDSYDSWKYVSETFAIPAEETIELSVDSESLIIAESTPTKISIESHGFIDGDRFKLISDFDMPSGLNKYNIYYVVNADGDTFELEESVGSGGLQFTYPQYGNLRLVLVKTISPFIRYSLEGYAQSKSYVHALMIGQRSEEFSQRSKGQSESALSGINIFDQYSSITSNAYGINDSVAHYLVRENRLLANNSCMPMVYGSKSLTNIYPERFGGPSVIFPGNGFLNESGRYRTHTLEFWLRISPDLSDPQRIVGPIASSDGLYIDGPFLILKIGDNIGSHYIGEWYRPMLIDISVFRNGASLSINGESVVSLSFDTSSLDLPERTNLAGKEQDWIGFYSYQDIVKYEIDCVAIYSYRVSSVIAKRRWVYGQAVDYPEILSSGYSGKSFPVDYTFSGYSNNYIYPDIVRWRQGILENVSSKNNVLQPPDYSLPNVVFNNKTFSNWEKSLSSSSSDGINLKPNDSWVDTDGYIYFENVDVLDQKTSGFYAVVEAPVGFNGTENLFTLENHVTGNYLNVDLHTINQNISDITGTVIESANHGLSDNDIIYFSGTLPAELSAAKEYFVIKIDSDTFSVSENKGEDPISISSIVADSAQFVANVIRYRLFFNSTESLVYQTPAITTGHSIVVGLNFADFADSIGGSLSTFLGNKAQLELYVGGNKTLSNTFSGNIYRIGFCTQNNIDKLDYLFTDNGTPFLRYQLDGGGYEDYTPEAIVDAGYVYEDYVNDILSHKASYTLLLRDFFGTRYLDIATSSYWQDYVPLSYLAKNSAGTDGSTSYGLDFIQYNSDTTVPALFDEDDNYDTSESFVRAYVSFQYIELGPTNTADSFANTQKLSKSKIVQPDSNWTTTKYEVVNGTLIYPPSGVDINDIAMVIHIDMSSKGIIKNPIRVRSLHISGKTLNSLMSNPVKTRFGVSIYPYTKYGLYYDYKAQNPFLMYKGSTPHLYLTKHSGMELTGDFSSSNRGLSIPVNSEKTNTYQLSNVQFAMRFTRDDVVTEDIEIAQIDAGVTSSLTKLWIKPSIPSDERFEIYATDRDGNPDSSIIININGSSLERAMINKYDWNMVSISFINPVDLGGIVGRINIVGPVLFNNLSYYALDADQSSRLSTIDEDVYLGIDPLDVYEIFTGTNKLVFGDDIVMPIDYYQYSFINGVNVQSATIKPV